MKIVRCVVFLQGQHQQPVHNSLVPAAHDVCQGKHIYDGNGKLVIRNMEEADAQIFTDEEAAQGWHPDIAKYHARLGVGLHNGYGSAQRMYVKRGFVPDGTGVWYRGKPCEQYQAGLENDDDLQLFFSKKLRTAKPEDQ